MKLTIQEMRPSMRLNFKNSIAFVALLFVMHEAHENVHTTIGRLLCGCWGERDFNVWGLCKQCAVSEYMGFIVTLTRP